jgi:dTDP-4-amino-4,6-dideoxygalactose transaminase
MSSNAPIPHRDLKAENGPIQAEIDAALRRVAESQQFVLGPEVAAFEREFASFCGAGHAVGCASGSDAVLLALMALDLRSGDQVICPSYTFFATASAITRLGGTPVFADVDPRTLNLDPEQARKAAARCPRLRALLPVDLFGQMADAEAFEALGAELGVPVICDAAQSVGARDARGRRAGSVGDIACISLYPTKNLGAYGDAGAVLTDDPGIADRLRMLHVHGARETDPYRHEIVGINSRLDAMQAAVLRVKLRQLDGWNATRRSIAARYDEAFAAVGARPGAYGADLDALDLPLGTPARLPAAAEPVYHQYAVRVPSRLRDELMHALEAAGIGSRVFYPLAVHEQPCFAELDRGAGGLPETEAATRENLCLPIHPALSGAQVDRVVDELTRLLRTLR